MGKGCCYRASWLLLAGVFLLLTAFPCYAHKINVFATVEGEHIVGYAYSRGGERIRHHVVILQNSREEQVGEATTNEQGEFSFAVTQRDDYRVVLELADGHRASFTVTADEFPETLPSATAGTERGNAAEEQAEEPPETPIVPEVAGEAHTSVSLPQQGISPEELERIVDVAVSRQIRLLREQLEAYEAKIRLHDTLGGIGYIVGITGIIFYVLGMRKQFSR